MTNYAPNNITDIPKKLEPTWTVPIPTPPAISLRDWFAGMAMQGTIPIDDNGATNTAIRAYRLADAMLKAREDKP